MLKALLKHVPDIKLNKESFMVVSPDEGAINRNMYYASVLGVACPLFVPLVEEGWHSKDDVIVLETVKRYLQPIIEFGADTLILGCTHYPVLRDAISKVLGSGVTLINAGTATSKAVADFLKENDLLNTDGGTHKFFVSDKPEFFKEQVQVLLENSIYTPEVEKVDINSL